MLNAKTLQERRKAVLDPKTAAQYVRSIKRLTSDADRALKVEIAPVTSKTASPPSGDKHDYMSQAPYFWKNPDTKTGFPYIRRDGERNPEILQYPDHTLMDDMVKTVETLSIGYYFTGKKNMPHEPRRSCGCGSSVQKRK
ncbi:MAG: alginate lyase family protein [Chloracidobacterium sp.]|nr:alginate lyase family protein [Chloracidobacterium sp.]